MDGIKVLTEGISLEFQRLLPGQRKTQRNNLALLVATMLDVRSANLMDLAAGLPRDAERIDMRYQWIERVLKNPSIDPDAVMAPFAREVLGALAAENTGRLKVVAVDGGECPSLAARYGIRGFPTVVAFAGGREVARHLGLTTKAKLAKLVENYTAPSSHAAGP